MSEMQFQRLTIEDRDKYSHIYRLCPEKASDYSFTNLFAWDHEREYEWAICSGLAWLKVGGQGSLNWGPVGAWSDVDWEKVLSENFPEGASFYRIPERLAVELKERLDGRVFLEEERSEWEYIYSVKDLIDLKGNRYHKKKNLLRQFLNNYKWSYHEVSKADVRMLLDIQEEWCSWKNCDGSPGLKAEHDAIKRVFQNWEDLPDLIAGVLFVEDRMVAYTVGEAIDEETLVIHFEKGIGDYKGVYQAINQLFLEKTASSFLWVNREQDMGNEGLRKAKMSYLPDHFLKKYVVMWKP